MFSFNIDNRTIGKSFSTFIIAEMSGNHNKSLDRALEIVKAAHEAGANAIKLQTYTPDTMTIDCNNELFRINGTIWNGQNLYQLYNEAFTPWEWHEKIKSACEEYGLVFFSTPFDCSAVEFLEKIGVSLYKVASSEIIDLPLLDAIAQTGKPVIISTGMATIGEIDEAIQTIRNCNNNSIALLKCVASYPSLPEEMNLSTIPNMIETFHVPVGLSDHTMGNDVSIASIAIGACIIERHLTLSRNDKGPDSAFSLEPIEFKQMVKSIRTVEKAIGKIYYGPTNTERISKEYRRSLFIVKDIKIGEIITSEHIRSIRPGAGLPPKYLNDIIGKQARKNIPRGTPVRWDLIE